MEFTVVPRIGVRNSETEVVLHSTHKDYFSSQPFFYGHKIIFADLYKENEIALPYSLFERQNIFTGATITIDRNGLMIAKPSDGSVMRPMIATTSILHHVQELERKAAKYDALQAALRSDIEK